MKNILEVIDNENRVSHLIVAEQTENQIESIQRLINKHKKVLEKFGAVRFKIRPREDGNKGGDQPKTYYLNEDQVTFLITLLRNNEIVLNFKFALVKAFSDLKKRSQDLVLKNVDIEDFNYTRVDLNDPATRDIYFKVFNGSCYYTGEKLNRDDFHIDHIHPRSLGGQDIVMNLVVCNPRTNIQKSNSYDNAFIQKHQDVVRKHYASRIVAMLSVGQKLEVSAKDIPSLLNAKTIDKIEDLFGKDITRKYYSDILGLDWGKVQKSILPYDEHIKIFVERYVIKDNFAITTSENVFDRYEEYCLENRVKPKPYNSFFTVFSREIQMKSTQKRLNGTRVRVYKINLKGE